MSRIGAVRVTLNGTQVPNEALHGLAVDSDIDAPDMCTITLNNAGSNPRYSADTNQGDSVEVTVSPTEGDSGPGSGTAIFKGEVVGLEPIWDGHGETKVIVRAFNRLHRLTRGRKSKSWQNVTDGAIAQQIASDNSLTPEVNGDVNITHEHIYQHNMTDLEFLLQRAARINYEVFVDDTKLKFRKRDVSTDSGIELKFGSGQGDYALQRFCPRLSTAGQVQEVHVRAWKWDSNETIVGKATSLASKLGQTDGPGAANSPWGKKIYYDVDLPVVTQEQADAVAKAKLEELAMNYITGDGVCIGNSSLKPGIVVKVTVGDTRFDGKYYLVGTTQRYSQRSGRGAAGSGGYLTAVRFRKNAEK